MEEVQDQFYHVLLIKNMMQDYVMNHVIQDTMVLDLFVGVHAHLEHINVVLYVWYHLENVLEKFMI